MIQSKLPHLRTPEAVAKRSSTVLAFRPSATDWHRLPPFTNIKYRSEYIFNRFSSQPNPNLIAWSLSNLIAFASSEPCYSPPNASTPQTSSITWPIFTVMPDNPTEMVLLYESDQPVISLSWNPDIRDLLLVSTTNSITLWSPTNDNVINLFDNIATFKYSNIVFTKWCEVPIKYKVENPNSTTFDNFSFAKKFSPEKPSVYPDPTVKTSFIALQSNGNIIWIYLTSSSSSEWKTMEFKIGKNFSVKNIDLIFLSYNTARIALISNNTPNMIVFYDIEADFINGMLKIASQPSSRLEIPVFKSSLILSLNHPLFRPNHHIHIPNDHKYTNSNIQNQNSDAQDSNDQETKLESIESNHLSLVHHLCFDTFDSSIIYIIANIPIIHGNQVHIEPQLMKWKANTISHKLKCPVDISSYIQPNNTQYQSENIISTINNNDRSLRESGNWANFSEVDDIGDAFTKDDYELWQLGDMKPNSPHNTVSAHKNENLNEYGAANQTTFVDDSLKTSSLVMETWECLNRTKLEIYNDKMNQFTDKMNQNNDKMNEDVKNKQESNRNKNLTCMADIATSLVCGRNILIITNASGHCVVYETETLEPIVNYVAENNKSSTQKSSNSESPNINLKASYNFSPDEKEAPKQDNKKKRVYDDILAPEDSINLERTTLKRIKTFDSEHSQNVHMLDDSKRRIDYDLNSKYGVTDNVPVSNVQCLLSSNLPLQCCISPNQCCLAILYQDMTIRIFHLVPLLSHRSGAVTGQQLCSKVVNLFELSIHINTPFWDIMVLLLALPQEEMFSKQHHIHRGVLLLLHRDVEQIEPRNVSTQPFTSNHSSPLRIAFECIKSAIYRCSSTMNNNWLVMQSHLTLRSILNQVKVFYKASAWVKKCLDLPNLDHPDIKQLFSTSDMRQETSKFEKQMDIVPPIALHLRWIYAITVGVVTSIENFIRKFQLVKQLQMSSSSPDDYFASEAAEPPSRTPGSDSRVFTPGHQQTPTSAGLGMMFESPHAESSHITPNPASSSIRDAAASPSNHVNESSANIILDLPPWFSLLPVMPENLEELLLINADTFVDLGMLWTVNTQLLTMLKESLIYFAIALHLDPNHYAGKEYMAQCYQYFVRIHEILNSPLAALAQAPQKYLSETWISSQVIPALGDLKPSSIKLTFDFGTLNLAPDRRRFLEMNYFMGESIPITENNSNTMNHNKPQFYHSNSQKPFYIASNTTDIVSFTELRTEDCKICCGCNRTAALNGKGYLAEITKTCPVCGSNWLHIKALPKKR